VHQGSALVKVFSLTLAIVRTHAHDASRYGHFGIFNYIDSALVHVGLITEAVVGSVDEVNIDIDIPSIVWSDGSTGTRAHPCL
jgi:hypothetical protein